MPGPVSKIVLAGAAVDDAVFFVPQSAGTALGISIFSYAGNVRAWPPISNAFPTPLYLYVCG